MTLALVAVGKNIKSAVENKIMLSDLKTESEKLLTKISELEKLLKIEDLTKKHNLLEQKTFLPDFWTDKENAQKIMQEIKGLKSIISTFQNIKSKTNEINDLIILALQENDTLNEKELSEEIKSLQSQIEKLELTTLLGGEHDSSNAILSINAGAGGTDAQDWAEILLRMYSRWAEKKDFEVEVVDISYGEQAGIKSAVLFIRGPYAYGYLKSENGIHRLVRMSPFNADGKRHTSFAAVEVIPETGEELSVEIKQEDLKIETFRASGPGGQNVNKTSSAVRITHLPTGIIAQSQNSPSQHRNREIAMKLLTARLKDRLEQEQKSKIEELKGEQKQIAWGSQIRSYVFAPYQLVKDHRTQVETGNVQNVIDGNIDVFIEGFLKNVNK